MSATLNQAPLNSCFRLRTKEPTVVPDSLSDLHYSRYTHSSWSCVCIPVPLCSRSFALQTQVVFIPHWWVTDPGNSAATLKQSSQGNFDVLIKLKLAKRYFPLCQCILSRLPCFEGKASSESDSSIHAFYSVKTVFAHFLTYSKIKQHPLIVLLFNTIVSYADDTVFLCLFFWSLVFSMLWLTGSPSAALWLGGGPRCSRLQWPAGHPVPAAAAGRPPAAGGRGHLARSRVRQRECQQWWRWRWAWLEVPQGPGGEPEPAEAPQPAGRAGGSDDGGGSGWWEDQGGGAEEVVAHPVERQAAPGPPPSSDHPQRLLQGRGGHRERGGAP